MRPCVSCQHQLQGLTGLRPNATLMIEALIMPDSVFTYSSDGEPGRCLVWTNLNRVTLILVLMHILLVLQAECLSPSRALAHDGHRLSPGDHRAWLSSDGGSGQGPSARADRLAQTEREAQEGGGMGGHGPAPAAGARPGEIMGEGQSLPDDTREEDVLPGGPTWGFHTQRLTQRGRACALLSRLPAQETEAGPHFQQMLQCSGEAELPSR